MMNAMKIPRKLGVSFIVICASAALMMAVFAANIFQINRLATHSNASRNVLAQVMGLETSILRENSQLRGFLVTGDTSYLKSYDEARRDFDQTSADLRQHLTKSEDIALLDEAVSGTQGWRGAWSDPLVAQIKAGQRVEAQERVRSAGKAALVTKPVLALRKIREGQKALIEDNDASQHTAIVVAAITLGVGGMVMIGLATMLAANLGKSIATPITELTGVMSQLASGSLIDTIPCTDRSDELGDMARAVVVFRDSARARVEAVRDRESAMTSLAEALHNVANADLSIRLPALPGAFEAVSKDFNQTLERLSGVLCAIRNSVGAINQTSGEIRQATLDLSNRSERQAANLQASATAMDDITRKVGEYAELATTANRSMVDAEHEAKAGGDIVGKAITAMEGIGLASPEIGEIIGLIDGIAFQTNLLALNAGVEAARAGEAGKGFAVVASEVRALAQRAADAAHDIKERVGSVTDHISEGSKLVKDTGASLLRIIESVSGVSELIAAMSETARNQSDSLGQVNSAIGTMETMTQQNAAMVEETTAATQSLAREVEQLAIALQEFRFDTQGSRSGAVSRRHAA